ncbi:hypothetical protein SDC9_137992 [bioreactor metagenome]|uniref:GmrSD restriction endonucleases C-terminal domain-containing protein n=1 Tax=bioreactor metagenome TaxID=1076179 RepID=A0A645DNL1_9ZZZZ
MKIDSVGSNILSLSEFKRLIQVFIELRCQLKPLKPLRPQDSELAGIVKKESFFAIELIELTRYSRYWTLPYVHAFFSCSGAGCKEDRLPIYKICLDTALTISKYLTVCSVTYDKVINPVQTFMCSTILPIMAKSSNVESHKLICEEIEKRITKSPYDPNGGSENKKWFIERISNDLFDNGKRAHIVCVLSGILEEIRCDKDLCHINEQFFSWEKFQFDVEHIYARANFSREDETNSRIYNSIGNLMVLDRNINRSIKDAPVSVKVEKYVGSKFSAVVLVNQKIKKTSTKVWKLEQVQDRLAEQCTLLCEYLGLDL